MSDRGEDRLIKKSDRKKGHAKERIRVLEIEIKHGDYRQKKKPREKETGGGECMKEVNTKNTV